MASVNAGIGNGTDDNTKNSEDQSEFDKVMNDCKKKFSILETDFRDVIAKINEMHNIVITEKQQYDNMVNMIQRYEVSTSDIIKLNVGGTLFSTLKSTLDQKIKKDDEDGYYDPNYLQLLVSGLIKPSFDENKAIFIDRDPQYFRYIIDYLRTVKSGKEFKLPELNTWDLNKLKTEAEFYQLQGLIYLFQNKFDDCQILTKSQSEELFKLCEFIDGAKWKLIYRASRDGFASTVFHNNCNSIQNTLTIIKTTNDYVFGGFASIAWDSSGNYKDDQNAFIFTLINHENRPLKLKYNNTGNGFYCNSSYGPTFGGGHDFYISSDSNTNNNSYSSLGNSYYNGGSASPNNFLAGSYNFQVREIEVFQKN